MDYTFPALQLSIIPFSGYYNGNDLGILHAHTHYLKALDLQDLPLLNRC